MRSRKRNPPPSARALPPSRLPLGAGRIIDNTKSFEANPSAPRSLRPHHSSSFASSSAEDTVPYTATTQLANTHDSPMPPPDSSSDLMAKATAEAKLERQRKRIEEADAALNVPTSLDRRAQGIRGKARQGKQSGSNFSLAQRTPEKEEREEVTEVRVNTFRAISRESSGIRPASRLSQRTTDTIHSDVDPQDPALLHSGFQVYTSRRNRKSAGELNPYEDKPEVRQTTVEASFDERHIYDVFGNALPGPAYLHGTLGDEPGRVQFIQHPNGDVSAHQWSADRMIWENIGQYSNIRKKVEGQLAADRLRGETAHQTLQQNSLAYFRTIARQREAIAMGIPFGPKEIEAAVPPQPRNELDSTRNPLKDFIRKISAQEHNLPLNSGQDLGKPQNEDSNGPMRRPPGFSSTVQDLRKDVRGDDSFTFPSRSDLPLPKYDDPFYSTFPYQRKIVDYPHSQPVYSPTPQGPLRPAPPPAPRGPVYGVYPRPPGFHYDYQPQPTYFPTPASRRPLQPAFASNPVVYSHHPVPNSAYGSYYPAYMSNHVPVHMPSSSIYPAPPVSYYTRPITPVSISIRTSMSDQLWKISETAKERSLSQSNIGRTVLYDPYQNQSSPATGDHNDGYGHRPSLDHIPRAATSVLSPPAAAHPTSSDYFPTILAPKPQPAVSPLRSVLENNLDQSSPDTRWDKRTYDHTTTSLSTTAPAKPTPQNFNGPFFPADSPRVTKLHSGASAKTYEEELNDWWTSGNKFARQQEFFESIMAAHKPQTTPSSASSTSRSHPPGPIGPLSRTQPKLQQQRTPSFNTTTTRLLIPVLENLAAYVQGPIDKRRDYFSQWSTAPEWAVDTSDTGNDSFFDKDWGTPPARVGRDPRYRSMSRSWSSEHVPVSSAGRRYASFDAAGGVGGVYGGGIDRRFGFAGR